MSTRSTIHFHDRERPEEPQAILYRHHDGYPDTEHGVLATLEEFFSTYEREHGHKSGGDYAGRLAARFIVWRTANTGRVNEIMQDDPGDIEYRYHVYSGYDSTRAYAGEGPDDPSVTYDERRGPWDNEYWVTHGDTPATREPEPVEEPEPEPEDIWSYAEDGFRFREADSVACKTYQFWTHPKSPNHHALILSGNDGTPTEHYVAYSYITDGDGFGREIYCGSKTYKTYKGALKKAKSYLSN